MFCPASEKKGPKGQLVTKYRGHVEYMRAIKKHFFATKISVVISHRRLTYGKFIVNFLAALSDFQKNTKKPIKMT